MSDPTPAWRKILLSGSNAYVHELYASGVGFGSAGDRVVTVDTDTGRFYLTGSYGSGGGGGDPGGNDTNVQFNNNGAFGGSDNFIFDSSGDTSFFVDGPITASLLSSSGDITASDVSTPSLSAVSVSSSIVSSSGAVSASGIHSTDFIMIDEGASTAQLYFSSSAATRIISQGESGSDFAIVYQDGDGDARVGFYITESQVQLVNRTPNGEVYIKASNSTGGGGSNEITVAKFTNETVDFYKSVTASIVSASAITGSIYGGSF